MPDEPFIKFANALHPEIGNAFELSIGGEALPHGCWRQRAALGQEGIVQTGGHLVGGVYVAARIAFGLLEDLPDPLATELVLAAQRGEAVAAATRKQDRSVAQFPVGAGEHIGYHA